jgi:hypothetical protein
VISPSVLKTYDLVKFSKALLVMKLFSLSLFYFMIDREASGFSVAHFGAYSFERSSALLKNFSI